MKGSFFIEFVLLTIWNFFKFGILFSVVISSFIARNVNEEQIDYLDSSLCIGPIPRVYWKNRNNFASKVDTILVSSLVFLSVLLLFVGFWS
jgi:uncharacterized membrane protein